METRVKILSLEEVLEAVRRSRNSGKTIKVVVGCFDPVLAAHARRVEALRDGSSALLAVVADPPRPILPARARAELVAALAAVDWVVIAGGAPVDDLIARLGTAEVVRSEEDDRRITEGLIQHVRSRHSTV